jgi:acetylglutamate kinase
MSQPLVIKAGGTTIEDPATAPALFDALANLSHQPGGLVFVHGGGKAVDRHLDRIGFTTERREGIRITPADQLDEITAVLAGRFNKSIVGQLLTRNSRAVGLCLGDGAAIPTRKTTKYSFDPGQVGEVIASSSRSQSGARTDLLPLLLSNNFLPVLCSIGIDADGRFLNINADDAAAGVAASIKARALVLLTDVPGVLDGNKKLVPTLTRDAIERMITSGEITGGMIPKVRAAADTAANAGVPVVIMAGNNQDTLAALGRGELRGTTVTA